TPSGIPLQAVTSPSPRRRSLSFGRLPIRARSFSGYSIITARPTKRYSTSAGFPRSVPAWGTPASGMTRRRIREIPCRRQNNAHSDPLERDDFVFESSSRSSLLVEHDLFRKPVPTPDQVRGRLFRDHALDRPGRGSSSILPSALPPKLLA